MEENKLLLEMIGIDKQFPGTHALNRVDFNLIKGEVHALIGQNGSGKSTLMNILSGGLSMDSGKIMRNGEEVHITSPYSALVNGIAMIHQELKLFPELTVAENIFFGQFPKKRGVIDWKKLDSMSEKAISILSTRIDSRKKIKDLSVAQQQLVEIARAISKNTEIVIMDEPTASLTNEETNNLFKVIEAVKARGITIIFISHRLDEILTISDRVTALRDGLLIGTLKREEIRDKDQLVDMMINIRPAINLNSEERSFGPVALQTNKLCMNKRLKDVSISLRQGEVLGIAGLVGAGRTELLKTIFGVYMPDSGQITVQGCQYSKMSPYKAVKLGIAYMSEDRKNEGLLLKMSIEDNEMYASIDQFLRYGLLNSKKLNHVVNDMTKKLRLKISSNKDMVNSLSGGNQQKVVIAKWLIANSSIILMDEPTRGIDVGAKSEIYSMVRELAKEGKSIIFVSSELEEIQTVSDRILVMREGAIVKELPAGSRVEEMMKYAV